MKEKITTETWGYTMVVENIGRKGAIGQWFLTLKDCFLELKDMKIENHKDRKITMIPRQYKDRMKPW